MSCPLLQGSTNQVYTLPLSCSTGPDMTIQVTRSSGLMALLIDVVANTGPGGALVTYHYNMQFFINGDTLVEKSYHLGMIRDPPRVSASGDILTIPEIEHIAGLRTRFVFLDGLDRVIIEFTTTNELSKPILEEVTPTVVSTTNSSGCDVFFMSITGNLDEVTKDGLYIQYDVIDCKYHNCGLGKYAGATSRITKDGNSGTRFSIINLKVNSVLKGEGTIQTKSTAIKISYIDLLSYIYFKIGMGRLLFGEIDLKWALTQNYNRLYNTFLRSDYATPKAVQFFADNLYIEQYLR